MRIHKTRGVTGPRLQGRGWESACPLPGQSHPTRAKLQHGPLLPAEGPRGALLCKAEGFSERASPCAARRTHLEPRVGVALPDLLQQLPAGLAHEAGSLQEVLAGLQGRKEKMKKNINNNKKNNGGF